MQDRSISSFRKRITVFTVHTNDSNNLLDIYKCARFWLGLLYLLPREIITTVQIKYIILIVQAKKLRFREFTDTVAS